MGPADPLFPWDGLLMSFGEKVVPSTLPFSISLVALLGRVMGKGANILLPHVMSCFGTDVTNNG